MGEIDSDKSVDIIKNYYWLLFPTRWDGEESAGTICESFIAGVPVIATDWKFNSEMIKSGYDVLIYPGREAKNL